MTHGLIGFKKDDVKYNLEMLNREDLSLNLDNFGNWNLVGKKNNYFIFQNKNTPYVIYVKFDPFNESYLNILLYKNNKDNLIAKINRKNDVDHLNKLQMELVEDFLTGLHRYYKDLKNNVKTNLVKKLITTVGADVTTKQEENVVKILDKLADYDIKELIEIFS